MWVSKTGTSHGPSDWVVTKSGIRAVLPRKCLQTVSSRVLFIGVLCTTSINRKLQDIYDVILSSYSRSCDRAILTG